MRSSPPPRILVLGDMAELGAEAEEAHRAVGRLARARGIEALYAVGTLSRLAAQGFGSGARHFGGQEELVAALRAELPAAATVLVKGSRASGMERVAAALLTPEGRSHAA
ncbi:MAG: hypothetical protein RML12_02785 [Xanthomonadales bacterium]|nr:hypothetical protein [Xanthomonadales bacterium]